MYVDEVGNHDMVHVQEPNQRFLALTGVITESEHLRWVIQPEMNRIKATFFRRDPDEPVIFHRKEMIHKKWPFRSLRDPEVEAQFNTELLDALQRWEYHVVTVVIDKLAHREQYQIWHYHPYHYCLKVILERYVLFLDNNDHRGDVMVESRGGREDRKLADSYARLYQNGTEYIPVQMWQARLTSKKLKIKPKQANIAGLQLADLIAHPSRREILLEKHLLNDERMVFGDQICQILRRDKYLRNQRTGQIWGYGKKLLP